MRTTTVVIALAGAAVTAAAVLDALGFGPLATAERRAKQRVRCDF